jgi:hypothetical protein
MNLDAGQIGLDTFFCRVLDFSRLFVELGACPARGRRMGESRCDA